MTNIQNRDARDFIKGCKNDQFDCIITDPPYEMKLDIFDFLRICKGNLIMFCAPENEFFRPDERAYWIKTPSTKNFSKHLGRFVEHILIFRRGSTFNNDLHWSNYTGVYTDILLKKQEHPYEKPLSLMERLVAIYSKPGDTILDPFAGSGTTLLASRNLGRRSVGVEIDPIWCELMETRLNG